MLGGRKRTEEVPQTEKVLDVDASMTGTLTFKDPVNLRINGTFEGELDTKGTLTIGNKAQVKAHIRGEAINVGGRVQGDIVAQRVISLSPTAVVIGDIQTPKLVVADGAVLEGRCTMLAQRRADRAPLTKQVMDLEEVARYLEVEPAVLDEWAVQEKIPATKVNGAWQFHRDRIEKWIASERVKI